MPGVRIDDHRLAAALATEAGQLLNRLRARLHDEDAPPSVLKAEGDRQAHELLMRRLRDERPGDAVLSEEGKDDPARLGAPRVWIGRWSFIPSLIRMTTVFWNIA